MYAYALRIASSGRGGACSRFVGVSWPRTRGQRVLVKADVGPNSAAVFLTIIGGRTADIVVLRKASVVLRRVALRTAKTHNGETSKERLTRTGTRDHALEDDDVNAGLHDCDRV